MNPGRLWPLAVIAVLALTVIANAWLLYEARGRDAAVVEPDYYRRAVAFDSTLAERRASAALGWQVEVALGLPDAAGMADLRVRLTGPDGAPLDGAILGVTATHNRIARYPVSGVLAPAGDGTYAARLPLRRRGLWELEFRVARETRRFTARVRCETGARAVR